MKYPNQKKIQKREGRKRNLKKLSHSDLFTELRPEKTKKHLYPLLKPKTRFLMRKSLCPHEEI